MKPPKIKVNQGTELNVKAVLCLHVSRNAILLLIKCDNYVKVNSHSSFSYENFGVGICLESIHSVKPKTTTAEIIEYDMAEVIVDGLDPLDPWYVSSMVSEADAYLSLIKSNQSPSLLLFSED